MQGGFFKFVSRFADEKLMKSRFGTGQGGYNILEVMMAIAIISVIALALANVNLQLSGQLSKSASLVKIDVFRRDIVSLVMSSSSWSATVNGTGNSTLRSCYMAMVGASPSPTPPPLGRGGRRRAPPGSSGANAACPGAGAPASLKIFDGSGGVFYNSLDARNGLTALGVSCGPDAPLAPYNSPNYFFGANCPYRYDLKWYLVTGGPSPIIAVEGELVAFNRSDDTHFNPQRYRVPTMFRPLK